MSLSGRPALVWHWLCPEGPSARIIFNYPAVDRGEDESGETGSATEVECQSVQYLLMWLLFCNLINFVFVFSERYCNEQQSFTRF